MYFAGIDIGSLSAETVIVDHNQKMIAYDISATGANSKIAAEKSFGNALQQATIDAGQLKFTVATGYGRISVPFADKCVTEITCHGRGASVLFPGTQTVIDIGGQDSKIIKIISGKVLDFAMNDKCAAGTGRFLEVMANALEVPLAEMGPLSLRSMEELTISSTCTVFAESEVVSLVAQTKAKEDIINGIHNSICDRIIKMAERMQIESQVTMTGGVAKNRGIVELLQKKLGISLNIPDEPQLVGALGAAIIASTY